jgi:excisionase family DNA binding protein
MQAPRRAHTAAGAARPEPLARERGEDALTLTIRLPAQLLDALAERLCDLLAERVAEHTGSPWLSLPQAAAYLGFTRDKLYKLSAARAIPVRKKRDGQGLLFHRAELDRWVEHQYEQEGWLP